MWKKEFVWGLCVHVNVNVPVAQPSTTVSEFGLCNSGILVCTSGPWRNIELKRKDETI